MSFRKRPGKNTPQCYTKPLDSLKNWNNRFFWVDERIFPTIVEWRTNAPKDKMSLADFHSADMDLFILISVLNTTKVKPGTRPQKSPLDFANKDSPQMITERGETRTSPGRIGTRAKDEAEANGPPKVLRKDHDAFRPAQSTLGGKSLAPMGLDAGSTVSTPATQDAPIAVAMGSQLRLRFEQAVRLLKKTKAKIARQEQRIQAREEEVKRLDQEIKALKVMEVEVHGLRNQTKNLETLLEAEVDMKKAAEAKNAELAKELESLRVQFLYLQVSNIQMSRQVSDLQAQVTGEEKIKTAFEEFKRYEDDRVEQRCAEMDACLDKLSGMSEGLKHDIEHGRVGRDLAAVEAYNLEADSKYVKALQDLKDLRYRLVDQLEKLKDAPMDLIMASLYLRVISVKIPPRDP
nr:hypothetical protein [Tanacetum cinerariifolium]